MISNLELWIKSSIAKKTLHQQLDEVTKEWAVMFSAPAED
jgi:hypothetical protein